MLPTSSPLSIRTCGTRGFGSPPSAADGARSTGVPASASAGAPASGLAAIGAGGCSPQAQSTTNPRQAAELRVIGHA
jgi:hypothetical protein